MCIQEEHACSKEVYVLDVHVKKVYVKALIMSVNEIISSVVCYLAMFSYLYLSKCCLNDKAFLLGFCADLTVRTNVFTSYTRYHLHSLP